MSTPQEGNEESRRRQSFFWNSVASGWIQEADFVEDWFEPVSAIMSKGLEHGRGFLIDIGCGAGSQKFQEHWEVIGIDVADQMLQRGSVRATPNCLPFQDSTLSGVSSRFCLMFCPDLPSVFAEIRRCSKPKSPCVFSVWGKPEENLWSSIPNEVFSKHAGIRRPEPNEPGAFRLSDPTEVEHMLMAAGFKEISMESASLRTFQILGARQSLETLLRLAGPMKLAFEKIASDSRATTYEEVVGLMEREDLTGSADVWICKT